MREKWFCGVTTAPRKEPTVQKCVDCLKYAGFEPVVFAEPGSPDVKRCDYVVNSKRLGVWYNWVHAAEVAVELGKPYSLIVQDDVLIHPESMEALTEIFDDGVVVVGPVSVYTPRAYSYYGGKVTNKVRNPGLVPIRSNKLWGAVGFAWRTQDLKLLLFHHLIHNWRGVKPAHNKADAVNSDVAIGRILNDFGWSAWFPHPSFGVHIAKYSSIPGHGSNDVNRNRNAEFVADFNLPLLQQLSM